ncbi:MAG: dihydrodipicolinate synthase family protein [Chloroflexi bacterium]|nr:dihydrodipicolinate synthase family protein [Chloroflexota bacterium]
MDLSRLHGIFPPMLTPLHEDQRIDHDSLASLADYLIGEGVHGLWAMGTTGEFACFDADERAAAVATTVKAARGRVPVVANVGDASTLLAIENGRRALAAGADALAATPPYYYANSQPEIEAHYRAIRSALDAPLLVYNIPQTVKVKVDAPVIRRLAKDGVIVGLKDSQNDLEWFRRVLVDAKTDGVDLRCFLGTTGLIDVSVYAGGAGAIPGVANVCAEACVRTYEAARAGDLADAARHEARVMVTSQLSGVVKDASPVGSSFAAMKAALVRRGVIKTAAMRAPFRAATAEEAQAAANIVAQAAGAAV